MSFEVPGCVLPSPCPGLYLKSTLQKTIDYNIARQQAQIFVLGKTIKYIWRRFETKQKFPDCQMYDFIQPCIWSYNNYYLPLSLLSTYSYNQKFSEYSSVTSTEHKSSDKNTYHIIPSKSVCMMRCDWVTTINSVTWVQPNCLKENQVKWKKNIITNIITMYRHFMQYFLISWTFNNTVMYMYHRHHQDFSNRPRD